MSQASCRRPAVAGQLSQASCRRPAVAGQLSQASCNLARLVGSPTILAAYGRINPYRCSTEVAPSGLAISAGLVSHSAYTACIGPGPRQFPNRDCLSIELRDRGTGNPM
jgi:hypothetical protein